VLLNHNDTTNALFTIAHELGHAMHSYYSNGAQPHAKHQYSIFVAEVASTVNEVLLLKHLLSKATDGAVRKYLLSYYLDMFRTTLFRQTMFAEFEKLSHDMEAKGIPLTPKSLSDKYYKLNKKYYGKAVTHDNLIRYEWAKVPHFYSAFYVYKYATGITAAVNIANAILKKGDEAVADYKRFLQSGGSDSPYELLKIAGVDLMKKEPFEIAMTEFKETLELLKKEF
jgi:oligoendopeptidase F